MAGTAKLRSEMDSRAMKAKNETAIVTTEPMMKRLRASSGQARPRRPGRKSWISPWWRMPMACRTSPTVVAATMMAISSHFIAGSAALALGGRLRGAVPPLTSATPATISAMPAQRRAVICSCSRTRPASATST